MIRLSDQSPVRPAPLRLRRRFRSVAREASAAWSCTPT